MGAPDSLLTVLGRRIRLKRLRDGLTLRALAGAAAISPRFLMDVEAGRGNISVRRLAAIAGALGTDLAELVSASGTDTARPIVALLGLRGAGKTSVGRRLARRLTVPFLELDTIIAERAGLALGEVFSLYGEDYYRRLEREVLAERLTAARPCVIAVGGGLVTAPDTFALLRRHAVTVWLRARPIDYWNRVVKQGDQRPMKEHPQARDALRDLIARREPLYRQADVTIDTAGLSVAQTVARVAAGLGG
ncbi:MAG: helix-turn-helix domain-containing protein [Acidobacteria bacterium]|nr:helix-turn-helix domain-containing protein [Acidobacteriota bacterium]